MPVPFVGGALGFDVGLKVGDRLNNDDVGKVVGTVIEYIVTAPQLPAKL